MQSADCLHRNNSSQPQELDITLIILLLVYGFQFTSAFRPTMQLSHEAAVTVNFDT